MAQQNRIRMAHAPDGNPGAKPLADLRFRNLLAKEEWETLPPAVRARFSKRIAGEAAVVYSGHVVETRMSFAGWCFAHVARFCGGPLPLTCDRNVRAVVSVTEDLPHGGQIWTRVYTRTRGFPQVIQSSKRFGGETGLEEYVGRGVAMALTVHARNGALLFRSAFYFLRVGSVRLKLPLWLTPGELSVTHAEEANGRFSFLLEVVHPLFGLVIRQLALFREVSP